MIKKDYVIISSWNGEGYSDPTIKEAATYDEAVKIFEQEIKNLGDVEQENSIDQKNFKQFSYTYEDNAGFVQLSLINNFDAIQILTDSNEVEFLTAPYEKLPYEDEEEFNDGMGYHTNDGFVYYYDFELH